MTLESGQHGQIETLTEQFDLFSKLCQGRNYICRQSLVETLPMTALMTNIWNSTLLTGKNNT
jgi:hypothetical protein